MLCPSCARVRVRVGGVAVHEHVECGKSDQERLAEGGVEWCLTCGQITANLAGRYSISETDSLLSAKVSTAALTAGLNTRQPLIGIGDLSISNTANLATTINGLQQNLNGKHPNVTVQDSTGASSTTVTTIAGVRSPGAR